MELKSSLDFGKAHVYCLKGEAAQPKDAEARDV